MRSNVKSPDEDNGPTSNALNLKKKQKNYFDLGKLV